MTCSWAFSVRKSPGVVTRNYFCLFNPNSQKLAVIIMTGKCNSCIGLNAFTPCTNKVCGMLSLQYMCVYIYIYIYIIYIYIYIYKSSVDVVRSYKDGSFSCAQQCVKSVLFMLLC